MEKHVTGTCTPVSWHVRDPPADTTHPVAIHYTHPVAVLTPITTHPVAIRTVYALCWCCFAALLLLLPSPMCACKQASTWRSLPARTTCATSGCPSAMRSRGRGCQRKTCRPSSRRAPSQVLCMAEAAAAAQARQQQVVAGAVELLLQLAQMRQLLVVVVAHAADVLLVLIVSSRVPQVSTWE